MPKSKLLGSSTHEEMGSGEPMLISGNEQDVRSCLFITKGIRIGAHECAPMTGYLALTFGTLLSSQGTDAHRPGSSDPSRGNRSTLCPRGARCQSRVRADSPGQAAPRRSCSKELPPARPLARPVSRGALTRLRIPALHVKSGRVEFH